MPQEVTRLSLPDARHLLTAGGLVAGVLGTLLLGGILRIDAPAVEAEPPGIITVAPVAGGSLGRPDPGPAITPPRSPATAWEPAARAEPPQVDPLPLVDRTDDAQRLANAGADWTLQFMVTCSEDVTDRLLQEVGADDRLYLLPIVIDDRACTRICWDAFRSRDRALVADFPDALRRINPQPIARTVAEVTP